MKINLHTCKYYFLTCNNQRRLDHFMKEFIDLDITEVNPIIGIERNKSGVSGFSRILDIASKQMQHTGFKPFGIFEDDVKKYREFPEEIEIPDNADFLFIGLSKYGLSEISFCPELYYTVIDDNIVRIYNMLTIHGFIICSLRGLIAFQKCLVDAYHTGKIIDELTAAIQPYYNVYALKKPLVYQLEELGGQEELTKFELTNEEKIIPEHYINKTDASVILCHPNCNAKYPATCLF